MRVYQRQALVTLSFDTIHRSLQWFNQCILLLLFLLLFSPQPAFSFLPPRVWQIFSSIDDLMTKTLAIPLEASPVREGGGEGHTHIEGERRETDRQTHETNHL